MKNGISRDVILVIGPSASGKTHALNLLRNEVAVTYGLQHELIPLSDSHTILERVREDDLSGGRHHYHPWTRGMKTHHHRDNPDIIPFTLAGNKIGHAFVRDFFQNLARLPYTGAIRYAEWSGGRNINTKDDPASQTDLSFTTITRLIRENNIPSEGLDRIIAAIHVATPHEYRMRLNENRSIPTDNDIKFGLASWPLGQTAMNIFGEDDFGNETKELLEEHHVPFIRTLHNDGQGSLSRELRNSLPEIISLWQGVETNRSASTKSRDRR